MLQLRPDEIGGGVVRRAFRDGDLFRRANTPLKVEDILRWPAANRNALIEKNFVQVFPKGGVDAIAPADLKRFVIHRGAEKYDVIEGRVLNDKPLSKKRATLLAKEK